MSRPLGLYERYSLTRTQMGAAPILSFIATVSGRSFEREEVARATAELLRRYPLLRSVIIEGRSKEPKYSITDITVDQVLEERTGKGETIEDLLSFGLEEGQLLDAEKGPLWKVFLFTSTDGDPQRLLLVINHTICDGVGARNLMAELLQLIRTPTTSEPVMALPPSQDTSVDLRPTYTQLASTVYAELVAPHLPSFLRARPAPPTWPNPPPVRPIDQPTALARIVIPAATTASLKASGRTHQVLTLQPLLHTAALASLVLTLSSDPSVPLPPLNTDTPTSLRSSDLGHPFATGNYVAVAAHSDELRTFRPTLTTKAWDLCRTYAAALVDPTTVAYGRGVMGMMKYIPDGEVNAEGQSAWEVFFGAKARAQNPYSAATSTSNLGVLPTTGWEKDGLEVFWAQTGSAFGQGIVFNVGSAALPHTLSALTPPAHRLCPSSRGAI